MKRNTKILLLVIVGLFFLGVILSLVMQVKKSNEITESALIKPKALTFDHSLDKNVLNNMILAARLYYTFWDTGDFKYLNAVISPAFVDHTLSANLTQGPQGQKELSNQLRSAIPDLHCSIEDLIIAGEMMTARLNFRGTSKYAFQGHAATGKPVEFLAIDILHFQDGKIVDAWRVEDKLSFYKQLNLIKPVS